MFECCPQDGNALVLCWKNCISPPHHKSKVEALGSRGDPLAIRWLDPPLVPELRLLLMDVDACMNPQLMLQRSMDFSDPLRLDNCENVGQETRTTFPMETECLEQLPERHRLLETCPWGTRSLNLFLALWAVKCSFCASVLPCLVPLSRTFLMTKFGTERTSHGEDVGLDSLILERCPQVQLTSP